MSKPVLVLERIVQLELGICLWFNRSCRYASIRETFITISWLGDGKFWYLLMLMLPLWYGAEGLAASVHMGTVGLIALIIYKVIKSLTVRPRPCTVHQAINAGTAPLDYYSFPSGHTMHAAGFTLLTIHYFPELSWLVVPFAVLIALSRVILGLHYPTDVAIGAIIGFSLASLSLLF